MTAPGDQVRVTVSVEVPIAEAFRIFTEEIDQWWRRGRRFRLAEGERGFIRLEPGVGGRLFESFERGGPRRSRSTSARRTGSASAASV